MFRPEFETAIFRIFKIAIVKHKILSSNFFLSTFLLRFLSVFVNTEEWRSVTKSKVKMEGPAGT